MANFMDMMKKSQMGRTEKGSLGYVTEGHKLVDLNFAIPSFRKEIDICLFEEALRENKNLALKWLLYLRDIRHGVGERKSFREFVYALIYIDFKLARKFIATVPIEEYGRWDDVVAIMWYVVKECPPEATVIAKDLFEKIKGQLETDKANMNSGKPVSLLAKWLPSENTSSKQTREIASFIRMSLGMNPRTYRKTLSALRKYIDVVERKMSANQWDKIDYEKVPSLAGLNYRDAFIKHDSDRYNAYVQSVNSGEKKINANAMFLHDIVRKYNAHGIFQKDDTLEVMWKAQNKVEGFSDTLVVHDGSGSMLDHIPNSGVTALDVADAITLYCAMNNEGAYKDKFVTFSSRAQVVDLGGVDSLHEKLSILHHYGDWSNTNVASVFNLVLRTAVKNNIRQEDMPKSILIISDMEFDEAEDCAANRDDTPIEVCKKHFAEHGYVLPKMIFWNVNSRTNLMPITQNENGVLLLSGFSKNLMDMVMSSEIDPYKALVKILNSGRYDCINDIVA